MSKDSMSKDATVETFDVTADGRDFVVEIQRYEDDFSVELWETNIEGEPVHFAADFLSEAQAYAFAELVRNSCMTFVDDRIEEE